MLSRASAAAVKVWVLKPEGLPLSFDAENFDRDFKRAASHPEARILVMLPGDVIVVPAKEWHGRVKRSRRKSGSKSAKKLAKRSKLDTYELDDSRPAKKVKRKHLQGALLFLSNSCGFFHWYSD